MRELYPVKTNAQTFETAVIDVLIPFLRRATKKIREIKALGLAKLTMWIQPFIVSDNSFGKTLISRASLRPEATGSIVLPNFVVLRNICLDHTIKTNPSPLKCIFPQLWNLTTGLVSLCKEQCKIWMAGFWHFTNAAKRLPCPPLLLYARPTMWLRKLQFSHYKNHINEQWKSRKGVS